MPGELATALAGCDDHLVRRVRRSLPASAAASFSAVHAATATQDTVARARRRVLRQLFWPLVYWLRPDDYEALIGGEEISRRVLDELDIDGRTICDIGAGTGRFALMAAPRARRVIAVDGVPMLLERLEQKARRLGLTNIETHRAPFAALPLPNASVDLAVACSAFTTRGTHGGDAAVDEAERIVRPDGDVAIIWPQHHRWLTARGYDYVRVRGEGTVHFSDVEQAVRLCKTYYSAAAARWVREHATADVPYSVLGVHPPNDLCIRRIP